VIGCFISVAISQLFEIPLLPFLFEFSWDFEVIKDTQLKKSRFSFFCFNGLVSFFWFFKNMYIFFFMFFVVCARFNFNMALNLIHSSSFLYVFSRFCNYFKSSSCVVVFSVFASFLFFYFLALL
jgi:hypothetical protein